ncbi:winged helix-turn-helix domain-containing protein [Streptacidiphilus sp. PAMC 29251]
MVSKGAKEALERRIAAGRWRPGESLPSGKSLADEIGVSRATMQKALQELSDEGLIITSPGKRAVLAPAEGEPPLEEPEGHSHGPSRTIETLQNRIALATRSGKLTIDAFCVTSESLVAAIQLQMLALRASRTVLSEFRIRLLVSNYSATPTFPRVIGHPDDHRPLARLQLITQTQVASLQAAVDNLRTFQLVEGNPKVEVRAVPFPPMTKLYVLNGNEVLEGFYQLTERSVDIGGEEYRIDDLAGLDSKLFWRTRHALPNHVDSKFVRTVQAFFESWWVKAERYGVQLHRDPRD